MRVEPTRADTMDGTEGFPGTGQQSGDLARPGSERAPIEDPLAPVALSLAQTLEPPPEPVAYNGTLIPGGRSRKAAGRSKRPLALLVALLLAVGSFALVTFGPNTASADAAHYRRLFTEGDKHSYRFDMSMKGNAEMPGAPSFPMDMSMSMRLTERVLDVAKDGSATVRSRVSDMRVVVDGESVPVPGDDITMTVRMSSDGRVLSLDGAQALGLGQSGPATDLLGPEWMGPLLPEGAIAPGDSWTVTDDVPTPFGQPMRFTARNKLVRLDERDGAETAVISSTLDVPMNMKIEMRDLIAMMRDAGQPIPPGMPSDAAFAYDGGLEMKLVQTIDRASGRPLAVVGDGAMTVGMRMTGIPGAPDRVQMKLDFDISLHQI